MAGNENKFWEYIQLESEVQGGVYSWMCHLTGNIIIRRPASALLDKLLCPPGPGGPAAAG